MFAQEDKDNLIFRTAVLEDIPQIIKLRLDLQNHMTDCDLLPLSKNKDEVFNRFYHKQILSSEVKIFLALDKESQIAIGMIMAWIIRNPFLKTEHYGRIDDMYVTPEYRRKKVAKRLLILASEFFFKKGISDIILEYAIQNEEAVQFWSTIGFQPILSTARININQYLKSIRKL